MEILCSTQCVDVLMEEETASEKDKEHNIKVKNDYKHKYRSETWQIKEILWTSEQILKQYPSVNYKCKMSSKYNDQCLIG